MKLLVFEFATATGNTDPSLTSEGHAMLEAILDDLRAFKPHYLVPNKFNQINMGTGQVSVEGDLFEWLNNNINEYDACLPIAPEESNILHDLTSIIEKNDVDVLGSNSHALRITTNKFKMYNELKEKVPVIKTEKIFFNHDLGESDYKTIFQDGTPKVLKPADGVSCSGVMVLNSYNELIEALNDIKHFTMLPYAILQEYITGTSVSVSLLSNGKTALPLSLNSQEIVLDSNKINYNGGKVPINHNLADVAKNTAKTAVESIEGIKGYVGVDMIIDNDGAVHLVEINSRLTTPYIALRKIINFNLGQSIINAVSGELPPQTRLNGEAKFYKEGQTLRVSVLK
jgi:predicted ATP-grasp superfamily ATP-dependent carboligase